MICAHIYDHTDIKKQKFLRIENSFLINVNTRDCIRDRLIKKTSIFTKINNFPKNKERLILDETNKLKIYLKVRKNIYHPIAL